MPQPKIHFDQIPLETVKKIVEEQLRQHEETETAVRESLQATACDGGEQSRAIYRKTLTCLSRPGFSCLGTYLLREESRLKTSRNLWVASRFKRNARLKRHWNDSERLGIRGVRRVKLSEFVGVKMSKATGKKNKSAFDLKSFLDTAGLSRKIVKFDKTEVIYSQGDAARGVNYIQDGRVRLSVVNASGKEAIIAVLGPGDFFGEGCMAGQPVCMGAATAVLPTSLLFIEKNEMMRVLHAEHELSDIFITHMLARNIRIEEDLVDQLFNSSEKRLARALLLLARYGKEDQPHGVLANVSQETLAEMIGTTRSRVNFFMNKFRKLGFIKYNGTLQINSSLLSVVLHE